MGAIAAIFSKFAVFIGGFFAAKYGVKIAVAAAIVTTYIAIYAATVAAIFALATLIPASPFPQFLLQFFPSTSTISFSLSAILGSYFTRMSFDFWRLSFSLVSKVAGS